MGARLHCYITTPELTALRTGELTFGYSKDSPSRPEDAIHHVDVPITAMVPHLSDLKTGAYALQVQPD